MIQKEQAKINNEMPNMTLSNIAGACGGLYIGADELKEEIITGVVIDSRQAEKGNLFIPIKGERADGHDFIPQVFEKGVLAVLSEHELSEPQGPYILVRSTADALKRLAAFYRQQLSVKVVGITGSVGKTSTKEMIASVLSQKYHVLKTAGNFNNEIGLPLTIFRIRPEHEAAVLEMGISDFGEMHRLAFMANPDICVITNIGWCHLENLHTRDGILQAKTECFEHLRPGGIVILNGDDDKLCTKRMVQGRPPVFYGIEDPSASGGMIKLHMPMEGNGQKLAAAEIKEQSVEKSVYASEIKNLGFDGISCKITTEKGSFTAHIPIPGEHNVYNALAAATVGLTMGLTLEEIQNGINSAETISGRINYTKVGQFHLIDDCYNANPVSMKASLSVLSQAKGRTIAVLGDMGELGEKERQYHYEVGAAVAKEGIDTLFCTGELSEEYARAVYEAESICKVFRYHDLQTMTRELLTYIKPGDTVLVKASHFMEFSKIVDEIKLFNQE